MAERAAQATGKYGGLGARGLDFGEDGKSTMKDVQESFSGAAIKYAPQIESDEEDEMLVGEDIEKEVKEAIEELGDGDDMAAYPIPQKDAGYEHVLREKFGHKEFRKGQLEAIKIILEERKNALVVLATGAGKSLCYQFCSQFLPGLVLVVTPLISLMSD